MPALTRRSHTRWTPPASAAQVRRTVWEFDARYWRIEPLDAEGRSLGIVYFEPLQFQSEHIQRAA